MQYLLISIIGTLQMALFISIGIIILDLLNFFFGSKYIVDNKLPESKENLEEKSIKN
jgi:hypothetical protein